VIKTQIIAVGLVILAAFACGVSRGCEKIVLSGNKLSAWVLGTDWAVMGDAFLNPRNENLLIVTEGNEVIVNSRRGDSRPLVSLMQFGDIRAHIEFVAPKNTNSGVFFQGRYELNICDSWGDTNSLAPGLECGGIYPRWNEAGPVKAYEGRSPRVNASRPIGQWQSFDVIFRSPRFDSRGNKIANACFEKVFHNGILIHENVEVTGPTRDSIQTDESATGPIVLKGDRGPVAFRNIWIARIEPQIDGLPNAFFAMDTATIDRVHRTAQSQAQMLKELGYAGVCYWEREPNRGTTGLAEMLNELDKHGLKLFGAYWAIKLEEPNEAFLKPIMDSIPLLSRKKGAIWLAITSDVHQKSSEAGDERAIAIINNIADFAHQWDVEVALYPHVDFWLEKTDDAVRLAKKTNRRNIGVMFNLYHHLRADGPENIEPTIKKAMLYLLIVTINGSSPAGSIETLDKGTFDVYEFLKMLKREGFTGPIGLQGYGIGGDVRDNLSRSISAWRGFSWRLAVEKAECL
jgi:sugar phosphate isomerase/epimerase